MCLRPQSWSVWPWASGPALASLHSGLEAESGPWPPHPTEEPLSLCVSAQTARPYKGIKWLIPGPRGPFPDVVATGASFLTLLVPNTQQVGGLQPPVPKAFQSPQQKHWRADRRRSSLLGQEVVSEAPTLAAGPDHAREAAAWADSPLLAGQSQSPGSGLPCRCLRGLSATPLSKPQTESPPGCGQAPHLPVSLAWMGTVFHHGAPTQQTPQQSDLWK